MAEYAFPWEPAAMEGDPMPEGLPLEEQLAFQAVGHLYARFRLKQISREAGAAEKGRIAHQLELNRRKLRTKERLSERGAALFKGVEGAANAYAKDRCLENADRLYRAIYGVQAKDEGRHPMKFKDKDGNENSRPG